MIHMIAFIVLFMLAPMMAFMVCLYLVFPVCCVVLFGIFCSAPVVYMCVACSVQLLWWWFALNISFLSGVVVHFKHQHVSEVGAQDGFHGPNYA